MTEDKQPLGSSKKAMYVMDSFVTDMLDRISTKAWQLCETFGKKTLSSKEIKSATRLILNTEEIQKHAIAEGTKAMINYNNSIKLSAAKKELEKSSSKE